MRAVTRMVPVMLPLLETPTPATTKITGALRGGQDDEQDHGQDEDPLAPQPVGRQAAQQGTDERAALHRRGVVLGLDDDQEERDRVQVQAAMRIVAIIIQPPRLLDVVRACSAAAQWP